ncbi:MAG: PHP domain-containing protein, partial [Spirochaetales bacterium]|nr:PHP domain-containing protein [Spirochaetales bacterium]MCF7939283.1 PHP domain-containing protein [Spirochaetales bacterium]
MGKGEQDTGSAGRRYKADLHIHSCLSPCGSLEMSPSRIVSEAADRGLEMAALTDHNSAKNCRTFGRLCRNKGIEPVFGIEATSREEAHLLCLFSDEKAALDFGDFIYDHLPDFPNIPDSLGDQVYVDENEMIIGEVDRYLGNATDLSTEELLEAVRGRGGRFIPAHINRAMFALPAQLGFLPELDYDAVELTKPPEYRETEDGRTVPVIPGYSQEIVHPIIATSDAHFPGDVANRYSIIEEGLFASGGIRVQPVFDPPQS